MNKALDDIENLIEKLKKAKDRKEKRRLMAMYNQKQQLVWGQKAHFGTSNSLIEAISPRELTL